MTRDEVIATLKELRYMVEGVSDQAEIALYKAVEMLKKGNCEECHYKQSVSGALEEIRADIEAARYGLINDGLDVALRIIDKHTEGR